MKYTIYYQSRTDKFPTRYYVADDGGHYVDTNNFYYNNLNWARCNILYNKVIYPGYEHLFKIISINDI